MIMNVIPVGASTSSSSSFYLANNNTKKKGSAAPSAEEEIEAEPPAPHTGDSVSHFISRLSVHREYL